MTEEKFNHYRHLCRVIANNHEEAEELLQDVMVKLYEKPLPPEKMNDNFVFIMIKNYYINKKKKESVRKKITHHTYEFDDDHYEMLKDDVNLLSLQLEDGLIQGKLDTVSEVYESLSSHDKKLFYLHFIEGISQRKISQSTGIGVMPIFYRFQKIKNKIKETYKNK